MEKSNHSNDYNQYDVKPVLNLKWYKNEDLYSDGDVEDKIIELIKQSEPEEYSKAIADNMSWPTYYHLTGLRKNILSWYPFDKNASVLEIGCGMGAITSVLCEKCKEVTAVELSKRRATATQLRCRNMDNLEVIVGNLNDIEFEKKFDYITLIGVLEYQGKYTNSKNPYEDFLKKVKGLLKDDGKLLIAIENKYGLKYWCGAPEDHTGVPFDGMNQYQLGYKAAQTFSRQELTDIVLNSGFKDTFFYYPMPDYKLPTVVYSEKYLPKNSIEANIAPYYYPNNTTLVANEMEIYSDLINNNVFEFFANSFLVECSLDDRMLEKVIFAVSSNERQKDYNCITTITSAGKVCKSMLQNHMESTVNNFKELCTHGVNVIPYEVKDHTIVCDYMENSTLNDEMLNAIRSEDREKLWGLFDLVLADISKSSEESETNILHQFNMLPKDSNIDFGKILKKGYVDMIARNAFIENGKLIWFDQEWMLENIPVNFILFRNIVELYGSYNWINNYIAIEEVIKHYNLEEQLNYYAKLRDLFSQSILDMKHLQASGIVRSIPQNIFAINVSKLLNK